MKKTYRHLTLSDRSVIESGICAGLSKAEIARNIGKDKSTVGNEIKAHRIAVSGYALYPVDCKNFPKCKEKACLCKAHNGTPCKNYEPFSCKRRDRTPGACNACPSFSRCHYQKYKYVATSADMQYRKTLVDSRIGEDLTADEAQKIADVIKPLLKLGQSPYHILRAHPELGICEKTLYRYIEQGTLEEFGIISMDLRRQVGRKINKKSSYIYKKRKDKRYLIGRKYSDFTLFCEENEDVHITEMDTVYNNISNGPFIQTFMIRGTGALIAFYHEEKTTESMRRGIDLLESIMGRELFETLACVILTDRGSEFTFGAETEFRDDKTRRTHIFYCDPMQSGQKGRLENKHEFLRYICPKERDLKALGLTSQSALNRALSNINSTVIKSLNGKSPLEYIEFLYPDLFKRLSEFGIVKLPSDKVNLNPGALKEA